MTLKRRDFLMFLGVGTTLALSSTLPLGLFEQAWAGADNTASDLGEKAETAADFKLPPLPYDYAALEPHIDTSTMQFHHDKHHAAYVKNLNDAVAKYPELKGRSAEDMIRNLNSVPEAIRTVIRNNGGGHINHSMFWEIMSPSGGKPTGDVAKAINKSFGSLSAFQEKFNEAGAKVFGSGWVWLVMDREGRLKVTSTPNQDSPLMVGEFPIVGNDVWEHAYYLNYQNRRADYLKAWWNVVNWQEVNKRFLIAVG
ncbi:superoxide dismutase [Pseudanabaena sp. PCC 6802]|uniref:superoxide dismutase n=1 Tax=Pseudanabaena sp. PCC 6802 TaxID=118173 RepID=UPI0003684D3C